MTIESKHAAIVRLAADAGLGQYLPAEPGLPGTWWGIDLERLQRFADLAVADFLARNPPPIMVSAADLDPELLRDMLAKAPPMLLQPAPPEPTPEAIAAAVAAEREACAWLAETEWSTDSEKAYGDELAAAIRARGDA